VTDRATHERDERDEQAEAEGATEAVRLGLYLSAVRCLLTYVLIPALGATVALTRWLSPVAATLQVLAAFTAVSGTRTLWRLRHPLRWAYAALAVVLVGMAVEVVWRLLASR